MSLDDKGEVWKNETEVKLMIALLVKKEIFWVKWFLERTVFKKFGQNNENNLIDTFSKCFGLFLIRDKNNRFWQRPELTTF